MLLGLAAVSAAVLALPSVASAELTSLHLSPTPKGAQPVDSNGIARLSTTNGTTVSCAGFSGSATFEGNGTTGTLSLTFGGDCTGPFGSTCTNEGAADSIVTTTLPFHLVTLPPAKAGDPNVPGVLVTPGANEHFATFTCTVLGFPVVTEVKGNGVIGTITAPSCGGVDDEATLKFEATSHGVQKHTKVADTETVYTLKKGSETAAQEAHGTLTLKENGNPFNSELVCT